MSSDTANAQDEQGAVGYGKTPSPEFAEMFYHFPRKPIDLDEYWRAPGESAEWHDKPHRLLYDCLREIYALRRALGSDVRGLTSVVEAEQRHHRNYAELAEVAGTLRFFHNEVLLLAGVEEASDVYADLDAVREAWRRREGPCARAARRLRRWLR